MRINWIELKGFKRMSLNNINFFKMTPTERIQLVLGTNGSGKSSLMGELSPLPAIPANFEKDGYKIISISHQGDEYVLSSHFSPSQKHSIVKNGMEELNTGGTVTVQRDIVKSIFGYRQDIHDLLTGVEKFSLMSPSRRRQWFTELCETNYDYAIGVYNKIAERSRDTSGALKLAKKRLVVETSKIISNEEVENIRNQIADLLREIDLIYNSRTDEKRDVSAIEALQRHQAQELLGAKDRLFGLCATLPGRGRLRPDDVQSRIDELRDELTRTDAQIGVHSKTHRELKEKYDAYVATGAVGLDDLRKKYDELIASKNALQARKQLKIQFDQPMAAQMALESVYDLLERLMHELPSNEDKRLSSEALNAAKEKDFQIKERINRANNLLEQFRHQKQHMEQLRDGESTECPSCKHRWIPGFSAENHATVIKKIDGGADFLQKAIAEQAEIQKVIDENTSYGELFREYMRCVRTIPILAPLWELLREQIYISPMYCYRIIEKLKNDLALDVECMSLDNEVIKNTALIELAIKANDADVGKMGETLQALETELGELASKVRTDRELLTKAQQELQRVQEIIRLGERIEACVAMMDQGVNDLIRATRNEILNDCLSRLQIELAQKQNTLNEINVQKGIVTDIEESIARLTVEEETLKLLVASLSPHDGLIAEGLLGFIRSFMRKMNLLIRKIWTYRLEVQDCSLDSEVGGAELDYKFPMLVGDSDLPVPDISKGSGGMREIIDLTFKIVAMQYLDLANYPLFADELGHAMDAEHKAGTVTLVKYLMDHCAFSQLYMISHDWTQYGALANTQTCVLNPSNIVVPDKFNEHVETA